MIGSGAGPILYRSDMFRVTRQSPGRKILSGPIMKVNSTNLQTNLLYFQFGASQLCTVGPNIPTVYTSIHTYVRTMHSTVYTHTHIHMYVPTIYSGTCL